MADTTPQKEPTLANLNPLFWSNNYVVGLWTFMEGSYLDTDPCFNTGVDTYSPLTVGNGIYEGDCVGTAAGHVFAPYVTTDVATPSSIQLYTAGADQTWPEGTIGLVLKNDDIPGSTIGFFRNGVSSITTGHLSIGRTLSGSDDVVIVRLRTAGTTNQLLSPPVDFSKWVLILVRFGGRYGLQVDVRELDSSTVVSAQNVALLAPMITPAGGVTELGVNITGSASGTTNWSQCFMADRAWDEEDLWQWFADPGVLHRPLPPANDFLTYTGPTPGRVTETGAVLQSCTGIGIAGSLTHAGTGMAVHWGTDPYNLAGYDVINVAGITDVMTPLVFGIAGLTGATRYYWRASWVDAAADVWPFPGGMGSFVTPPADLVDATTVVDFTADSHAGAQLNPGVNFASAVGLGPRLMNLSTLGESHWAISKTFRQIYLDQPALVVALGDHLYQASRAANADLGLDPQVAGACQNQAILAGEVLNSIHHGLLQGGYLDSVGNHGDQSGGQMFASTAALEATAAQAQATIARKLVVPNPGPTTYSLGGENEGTPGPTKSWCPPNTGDYAAYPYAALLTDYLDDGTYNRSPLENYGGVSWGNLGVLFLDGYRYTNPGSYGPLGIGDFPGLLFDGQWWFGDPQIRWLHGALKALRHFKFRVVVGHQSWGGGLPSAYGRDSWGKPYEGCPSTNLLHWLYRLYGVQLVLRGHDHVYARSEVDGITYVCVPTCGSQIGVSEALYGTVVSRGGTYPSGVATAHIKMFTGMLYGYFRLTVTAASMLGEFRHTYQSMTDPLTSLPDLAEKWIDDTVVHATNTVPPTATLSEVPDEVTYVCLDSGYDPTWAAAQGADRKLTAPGNYTYDGMYPTATINNLAAACQDKDVRVLSTPRTLDSFTILAGHLPVFPQRMTTSLGRMSGLGVTPEL